MSISNLDRFSSALAPATLQMCCNGVNLTGEQGCFLLEQAKVDDKRGSLGWVTEWMASH